MKLYFDNLLVFAVLAGFAAMIIDAQCSLAQNNGSQCLNATTSVPMTTPSVADNSMCSTVCSTTPVVNYMTSSSVNATPSVAGNSCYIVCATTSLPGNMTPFNVTPVASNMTTSSVNGTTPAPGNMTTPSPDTTTQAPGSMTTPSPDTTTQAPGNMMTSSPDPTTSSPGSMTTSSPDTTTPSPGSMTTSSPDTTTPAPGNIITSSPDTTTPSDGSMTTSSVNATPPVLDNMTPSSVNVTTPVASDMMSFTPKIDTVSISPSTTVVSVSSISSITINIKAHFKLNGNYSAIVFQYNKTFLETSIKISIVQKTSIEYQQIVNLSISPGSIQVSFTLISNGNYTNETALQTLADQLKVAVDSDFQVTLPDGRNLSAVPNSFIIGELTTQPPTTEPPSETTPEAPTPGNTGLSETEIIILGVVFAVVGLALIIIIAIMIKKNIDSTKLRDSPGASGTWRSSNEAELLNQGIYNNGVQDDRKTDRV